MKSNLQVRLANGCTQAVEQLLPPEQQAYLFKNVQVLDGIACHLVTARVPTTKDPWAVLSDQPPSLQTFALYGKRFGGMNLTLRITSLLPSQCCNQAYEQPRL